jgi:hypothetical protein
VRGGEKRREFKKPVHVLRVNSGQSLGGSIFYVRSGPLAATVAITIVTIAFYTLIVMSVVYMWHHLLA